MKMKIWIEEAMKEMVEEVEKNEPMPKHWKRNVLLFCLLSAVCFQKTALLPLIEVLFSLQLALSVLCWWELC